MKYVALPVNEKRSIRFERLCERLDADTPQKIMTAWGHICTWYTRWAFDPEMDHGVLWGVNLKRMGIWSEWPDPQKFGNALEICGYVSKLTALFSDLPADERDGYIVLNGEGGVQLDWTWSGVHRDKPLKDKLVKYLTDPRLVLYYSNKEESNGSGASAGAFGRNGGDGEAGTSAAHLGDGPPLSGKSPGCSREESGNGPGALRAPSAPNVNVKEVTNVTRYVNNVTEQTAPDAPRPVNNSGNGTRKRTSYPKTTSQRDFIRSNRYDDPIACLDQLDPTCHELWVEAVERDYQFVVSGLSDMVETDETWAMLGNPIAPFMKKLLPRIKTLRVQQRRRQNDA